MPLEKKQSCVSSPGVTLPPSINNIVLDRPYGEVEKANAYHHVRLHATLAAIAKGNLFAAIRAESPLHIAAHGSAEVSGVQAS
ncbi:MAG: hypothetical protein ACKPKO_19210, partial [Candidatus Fonsibacter sp.]